MVNWIFLKRILITIFIFPIIGLLRGHAWESFSLSLKFLLFLTMSFLLYFLEAWLKCILTQNEPILTKLFREWKSQGIIYFLKSFNKGTWWRPIRCKPRCEPFCIFEESYCDLKWERHAQKISTFGSKQMTFWIKQSSVLISQIVKNNELNQSLSFQEPPTIEKEF